jgi:hypothetical protein
MASTAADQRGGVDVLQLRSDPDVGRGEDNDSGGRSSASVGAPQPAAEQQRRYAAAQQEERRNMGTRDRCPSAQRAQVEAQAADDEVERDEEAEADGVDLRPEPRLLALLVVAQVLEDDPGHERAEDRSRPKRLDMARNTPRRSTARRIPIAPFHLPASPCGRRGRCAGRASVAEPAAVTAAKTTRKRIWPPKLVSPSPKRSDSSRTALNWPRTTTRMV